jgi:dTMP kinase
VLGRHGRHLPAEFVAPVLKAAARELEPELVVLIDVDPALARARRKSAKLAADDQRPPSRKGLAGVGLQHRLRRGYLEMAASDPQRWVVIDNEDRLEDVVARVTQLIDDARNGNQAAAIKRFRAPAATLASPARPAPADPAQALQAFLARVDARAEGEPRVAAHLLGGLYGAAVDQRRRTLAASVPEAMLAGLEGLSDEVSWNLRDQLAGRHPRQVAASLNGLPAGERASAMRLVLERDAPAEVALSLTRIDDDPSFAQRQRLFEQRPDAVMASLAELQGDRPWGLRQRWLDQFAAQVAVRFTAAQVSVRSVYALDDERAWQMRKQARETAPVIVLASLVGLTSERAWRWRQDALARAPKIVMATIWGMTDARAWALRRAVIADCKEALDSLYGLDDAQAWELREAHCDRWPSTVVKSLGPLGTTARGRTLVDRQLAHHPNNLSLLKHAAAVALGVAAGVVYTE